MQKNTTIDKKIPVTVRVTGCLQGIKVLNSGDADEKSVVGAGIYAMEHK